jgi:hypothetical protein
MAQIGLVFPVLFSLYVNDMPMLSHYIEFRGRHGFHSHVPQSIASRLVSRDLSQEAQALATGFYDS